MEDRKRERGRGRGGVREEEEGAEIPSVVKETGRFPDARERERETSVKSEASAHDASTMTRLALIPI